MAGRDIVQPGKHKSPQAAEGKDGGRGEGGDAAAHATHLLGQIGVGTRGGRQGVQQRDAHDLWGS